MDKSFTIYDCSTQYLKIKHFLYFTKVHHFSVDFDSFLIIFRAVLEPGTLGTKPSATTLGNAVSDLPFFPFPDCWHLY